MVFGGGPRAATRSRTAGSARNTSLRRVIDASARWKRFITQLNEIIGQVSIPRYMPNATKLPTEIPPRRVSIPPAESTITAPAPASNPNAGFITPLSRANSRLRRTYSRLIASKRATSASS